jgi:hypothetical protein
MAETTCVPTSKAKRAAIASYKNLDYVRAAN